MCASTGARTSIQYNTNVQTRTSFYPSHQVEYMQKRGTSDNSYLITVSDVCAGSQPAKGIALLVTACNRCRAERAGACPNAKSNSMVVPAPSAWRHWWHDGPDAD